MAGEMPERGAIYFGGGEFVLTGKVEETSGGQVDRVTLFFRDVYGNDYGLAINRATNAGAEEEVVLGNFDVPAVDTEVVLGIMQLPPEAIREIAAPLDEA